MFNRKHLQMLAQWLEDTQEPPLLFPEQATVTVLLTAGTPADTWCAWTELASDVPVTFSSKFATYSGFVTEVMLYGCSVDSEVYIVELAYGDDKVAFLRTRVYSEKKTVYKIPIRSPRIPIGSAIYYRMKGSTALITCATCIRYRLSTT